MDEEEIRLAYWKAWNNGSKTAEEMIDFFVVKCKEAYNKGNREGQMSKHIEMMDIIKKLTGG